MATISRKELEERVLGVIREILGVNGATLRVDTSIDELGVSSLDRMTLMLALEDEFGGTVPPEDAYRIKTVGHLVDYIESRLRPG